MNGESQQNLVRRAWDYNLHRGTHAAGYFAVTVKDGAVLHDKFPYSAEDVKLAGGMPVSSVLGAHTRAATKGDVEDNRNNHPVFWDGVWTTHNGTITNHDKFKKQQIAKLGKDIEPAIPDVDSVAISMALSMVDPWDIESIIEIISDFQGGYAFHSVWEEHPTVSLLVRGKTSPLVVRYHPLGLVVYGSEDDSTFALIDGMGLDPNDDAWLVRRMDEHTAMIIVDGVPTEFASFKFEGWGGSAREIVRRLVTRKDKSQPVVYTADKVADWATHNNEKSLNDVDPKNIKLVYTREMGFTADTTVRYPISTSDVWSRISEADNVYKVTSSKNLHAFYGNVEVVFSEYGSLRDIFHHDVMKDEDRWEVSPNIQTNTKSDTFESFLRLNSTTIVNVCDKLKEPKYLTIRKEDDKRFGQTPLQLPRSTTGQNSGSTSNDKDVLEIGRTVGMSEFMKMPQHPQIDSLVFFADAHCDVHGTQLTKHPYPLSCESVLLCAFAVYSCFDSIDMWPVVFSSSYMKVMREGNLPKCQHPDREIYYFRKVEIDNVAFRLPLGDRCKRCLQSRMILRLPKWVEDDKYRQNLLNDDPAIIDAEIVTESASKG